MKRDDQKLFKRLAETHLAGKRKTHILMKVTLMKINYCKGLLAILLPVLLASCGGSKTPKNAQGQLIGVSPRPKYYPPVPYGMVYVPSGTFHMGPSDEDVNYSFTARNKAISISGF
ncbi:hypothetical protein MKQ70_29470 [Chitinophaga sedimenti]|uniref:hypothetical protein n=1 Tax=Chitinophaga sedimenti TaxID=2033606 RepID=UPI002006A034|nr:hypothetical protein [Chitinophaga sedimenti]MCK7558887.1 hypothetical protein [Chitinophaga sedimenti]